MSVSGRRYARNTTSAPYLPFECMHQLPVAMRTQRQSVVRIEGLVSSLRGAVSLVEVLIAVGILSLLLALALPAIQRARESARRIRCINNLKQLSQASDAFHAVHRSLPPTGFVRWHKAAEDYPGVISPWGQLLPYLENSPLHEQIDYSETAGQAYPAPGSTVNGALLQERLPVLECPSDDVPAGGTSYRVCQGIVPGASSLGPGKPCRGAYFSAGGRRALATWARVTDGLSQTALCSEKIVGDGDQSVFMPAGDTLFVTYAGWFFEPDVVAHVCARLPATSTSPHSSYGGATWLLNGYAYTWYNHVLTPNSRTPDCTNAGGMVAQGATTARSWHPGGVNLAMADGAVRFVSENIDLQVWRAVGTRDGGETVGDW